MTQEEKDFFKRLGERIAAHRKARGLTQAQLAETLGTETRRRKRGSAPKLQQQLEPLYELPKSQQRFVSQMLEGVLQRAGR